MKTAILFLLLVLGSMPTHAQDPTPVPDESPVAEEVLPEEAAADESVVSEEAPVEEITETEEPAVEPEAVNEEATEIPQTDAEVIGVIGSFVKAVNSGDWTLVFAFGVMILIYLVRRLGLLDKLPADAVVWVSLAISVLGCAAAALIDGAAIGAAILQGVVLGLSSAGLWSAGGKHGLPLAEKAESAD